MSQRVNRSAEPLLQDGAANTLHLCSPQCPTNTPRRGIAARNFLFLLQLRIHHARVIRQRHEPNFLAVCIDCSEIAGITRIELTR